MESYDFIIIGAGWAGISAALKADSLGLKVALIEKGLLGGTCLNQGCIPTRFFIKQAELYSKSQRMIKNISESPQIDFKDMKEKKDALVERLRSSLEDTIKHKKNINYIKSSATFRSESEIETADSVLRAKHIIIATGSKPQELSFLRFDYKKIISTDELLELEHIPATILIVGAGVSGCEIASLFNLLGSKVTLVESMPHILPAEDQEISLRLEGIFKKRGIRVLTSTDIRNIDISEYEIVLVSVGRIPNTEGLSLEKTQIKLDNFRIVTDDYLRTDAANIYAMGDCTNKLMFAHLASYQGRELVENIATNRKKKISPEYIPHCIFTYPEVSRIGLTEQQARDENLKFEIHRFDFLGLGMSHVLGETDGLIKIISDRQTNNIVGASILGPYATEIISVLNVAIQKQMKVSELRDIIFGHPTVSEAITEALK